MHVLAGTPLTVEVVAKGNDTGGAPARVDGDARSSSRRCGSRPTSTSRRIPVFNTNTSLIDGRGARPTRRPDLARRGEDRSTASRPSSSSGSTTSSRPTCRRRSSSCRATGPAGASCRSRSRRTLVEVRAAPAESSSPSRPRRPRIVGRIRTRILGTVRAQDLPSSPVRRMSAHRRPAPSPLRCLRPRRRLDLRRLPGRLVRCAPPWCDRCGAPGPWPVRRCAECSGRRLAFAAPAPRWSTRMAPARWSRPGRSEVGVTSRGSEPPWSSRRSRHRQRTCSRSCPATAIVGCPEAMRRLSLSRGSSRTPGRFLWHRCSSADPVFGASATCRGPIAGRTWRARSRVVRRRPAPCLPRRRRLHDGIDRDGMCDRAPSRGRPPIDVVCLARAVR